MPAPVAIPVAIAVAVEVIEKAVKVAEAIQKVVGFFSPAPADRTAELIRKIDQISADIVHLRQELRELGQKILQEIERTRQTVQLFELNRMLSLAESALHSLQTYRLTKSQFLKDSAIRDSDVAVTELKNAQAFADRAAAIGPFLFVVNVRMQIIAELVPSSFSDSAFRLQVEEWVEIVRIAADAFEEQIRIRNNHLPVVRGGDRIVRQCEIDPDRGRVCGPVLVHTPVTKSYRNITETVHFESDEDDPAVGSGQPFRSLPEAIAQGVRDDLQNLGINSMRQIAHIWESTRRISRIPPLWTRVLGRPLTDMEFTTMTEVSETRHLSLERLTRGLLLTDEFVSQSCNLSVQEKISDVFRRVVGRDLTSNETELYMNLNDQLGYNAFVAAVSTLATSPPVPSEERSRQVGLSTLDVLRDV